MYVYGEGIVNWGVDSPRAIRVVPDGVWQRGVCIFVKEKEIEELCE
jgi:hypothetical protein